MAIRGGLSPCPFCEGRGLLTFERGPEIEPCTECNGTGRLYTDPTLKGLFAELLRQRGPFLDADLRLLLLGLDALDRRLAVLENESLGG